LTYISAVAVDTAAAAGFHIQYTSFNVHEKKADSIIRNAFQTLHPSKRVSNKSSFCQSNSSHMLGAKHGSGMRNPLD